MVFIISATKARIRFAVWKGSTMSKLFRRRFHWPLKTQLVICFLLVALVPTSTLCLFFSHNAVSSIKSSNIDTRTRTISQILDNVDKQAEWVETMTTQIYLDTDIVQIGRAHV